VNHQELTIDTGFNCLLDWLLKDLTLSPYLDNSPQLLLDLIRCPSVSSRSGFGDNLAAVLSNWSSFSRNTSTYRRESYEKVVLASSLRLLGDFYKCDIELALILPIDVI